jgi:hypothetical protein
MIKTTNAMMMKFINSPRKAPQLTTIDPIPNIAVCQAPPGINGSVAKIILLPF